MLYFSYHPVPTENYTLSLHDALPICGGARALQAAERRIHQVAGGRAIDLDRAALDIVRKAMHVARIACGDRGREDRKSTRLNSSHPSISYAVFCLKKKTKF